VAIRVGQVKIEFAPSASRGTVEGSNPAALLDGYSIYAAGLARCFTAAIRVFAAGPEECGFCPVISWPSARNGNDRVRFLK
jgi:hypothetical protein